MAWAEATREADLAAPVGAHPAVQAVQEADHPEDPADHRVLHQAAAVGPEVAEAADPEAEGAAAAEERT